MSLLGMPLAVINLGGEMMYILEQRLIAQKIPAEKARKVTVRVAERTCLVFARGSFGMTTRRLWPGDCGHRPNNVQH